MKLVILVAVVWTLGYFVACCVWPFATCQRCDGAGRHMSPGGKAWRLCRRCKGTGTRLRIGRRVANWVITRRRAAS